MTAIGIDTATRPGSVAVARAGAVLAQAELSERGEHARDLLQAIDDLLRRTGLEPAALGGVAVTLGPGSFTGVRIGLATAKGLAYALDIGLAGLSTLEALARAARPWTAGATPLVCAALAAGRGEVYAATFRFESEEPLRQSTDRSWRPADLVRDLPEGTRVVGDAAGALRCAAATEGRRIEIVDDMPALAGCLAGWACRALPPGTRYRAGEPLPNYVRPLDAQSPRR